MLTERSKIHKVLFTFRNENLCRKVMLSILKYAFSEDLLNDLVEVRIYLQSMKQIPFLLVGELFLCCKCCKRFYKVAL